MLTLCRNLWNDETGFIISTELVLLSTVGVIGMTAGLTCLRDSVVGELNDVAGAIGSLNQSYCYTGFSAASPRCCKSRTVGSCFTDHEEAGSISRVDIQGPALEPTPAAGIEDRVIEQRIIEERVVEEPCLEQPAMEMAAPAAACEPSLSLSAPVIAGATGSCSNGRVPTELSPTSTCGPQRQPQHATVDACGNVLHYSETRGEAVRLIDEVDAIHRPVVTPSVKLW